MEFRKNKRSKRTHISSNNDSVPGRLSTIFACNLQWRYHQDIETISSNLDKLKHELSTGQKFSSESFEQLSMFLHTCLLEAKHTDSCKLFDLYLNDSHCSTFRSLIQQSECDLSFTKGLVNAFKKYYNRRIHGLSYKNDDLLLSSIYSQLTSKSSCDITEFVDKFSTFFVKIHTYSPNMECLITDQSSRQLLNLLKVVLPVFYDYLQYGTDFDDRMITGTIYGNLFQQKLRPLLVKILEAENCEEYSQDHTQLFLTCIQFYLPELGKLLLDKKILNIRALDGEEGKIHFDLLSRSRDIAWKVPEEVMHKWHNFNNMPLFHGFLSFDDFDVNETDGVGDSFVSRLCPWIQEIASKGVHLVPIAIDICKILENIGSHPSATNETIVEALLKLAPCFPLPSKFCGDLPYSSSAPFQPTSKRNDTTLHPIPG